MVVLCIQQTNTLSLALQHEKEKGEKIGRKKHERDVAASSVIFSFYLSLFSKQTDPNYELILVLSCPLSPKWNATPRVAHECNIAML